MKYSERSINECYVEEMLCHFMDMCDYDELSIVDRIDVANRVSEALLSLITEKLYSDLDDCMANEHPHNERDPFDLDDLDFRDDD